MKKINFVVLVIVTAIFLVGCNRVVGRTKAVSDEEVAIALAFATDEIGKKYVWGANGPNSFDCSGLIVWSYQQALEANTIFNDGDTIVSDVTMQTIYEHNTKHISSTEAKPGDVIFITHQKGKITHGGIVVAIEDENVTMIDASSVYGEVILETWLLAGITRDQWIVGFGRMLRSYP